MQHSKADRGKTERQLKSKVDRDEIDDIAARLAGDKDDDLDPTLVRQTTSARLEVPELRPAADAGAADGGGHLPARRLRGRRTIKS